MTQIQKVGMGIHLVEDLDSAIDEMVVAGATVARPASAGPHEVRTVLRDPAGNAFVVDAALGNG